MSWFSYSSLIPPNLFILMTTIGVLLAWRWTRLGLRVATLGVVLLYLLSTPIVGDYLIWSVEALADAIPALPSEAPPGAIVVLSADYRKSGIPGEPDRVGPVTLERLAAAAREERSLGGVGQRRPRGRRRGTARGAHGFSTARRFPGSGALA